MAPEVKIRNLDQTTIDRAKVRADTEGTSMEALLRTIVTDALGGEGVTMSDWENAGFDEVDEIVPGRLYEVRVPFRWFRIAVTRSITAGATPWNSTIDERVCATLTVDDQEQDFEVWTSATQVADRLIGKSAEMALRDAIHWLSVFAGVDAASRARRAAADEAQQHPGMYLVVGSLREHLGPDAVISWQDRDVARVSMGNLNFVVSRPSATTIVMNGHIISSGMKIGEQTFHMSPEIAGDAIAAQMRMLVQVESDNSKARKA